MERESLDSHPISLISFHEEMRASAHLSTSLALFKLGFEVDFSILFGEGAESAELVVLVLGFIFFLVWLRDRSRLYLLTGLT